MEAVRIQLDDFSLDAEISACKQTASCIGGIATFLGCARDFSEGRAVAEIHFDAYQTMALAEMQALRQQAMTQFDLLDARLVHRVGAVKAGDNIVLIVAAARHRGPAFEACQWLIDELKKRVPIWKKEITPEGDFWVSARP